MLDLLYQELKGVVFFVGAYKKFFELLWFMTVDAKKRKEQINFCNSINLIWITECAEMNNNETVAVQLEKERPENLKCNRSSEKYKIQWRKVEKRKILHV